MNSNGNKKGIQIVKPSKGETTWKQQQHCLAFEKGD